MVSPISPQLAPAIAALHAGQVIAYPTEAVYGLGCDLVHQPAVQSILQIKQRPMSKGMIIVAGEIEQLDDYIDWSQLEVEHRMQLQCSPLRPTTWIVPASEHLPVWIRGDFATVAVRLSTHPTVKALCAGLGRPIVSTSANLAGHPPARSAAEAARLAGVDLVLEAPLGGATQPSQIVDIKTGKIVRS